MFYSSMSIDNFLKCTFCKLMYVDVVKLIPDCGHSICLDCYLNVQDSLNHSGEFKCQSCNKLHKLPSDGLPDNRALMDMIKVKPEEKALNDKSRTLKTRLEDMKEKIQRLERMDESVEINAYCDLLQAEVEERVQSAIRHVNKQGEDFLKEIDTYRQSLLENDEINPKSTKRRRTQSNDANQSKAAKAMPAKDKLLQEIAKKAGKLDLKWQTVFTQIGVAVEDEDIEDALVQVELHQDNLDELEAKMVDSIFNRRYLRFKSDIKFFESKNLLGKLVYENSMTGNRASIVQKHSITDSSIRNATFLKNGLFATISDSFLEIWHPGTGKRLHKIVHNNVSCLASQPHDQLALAYKSDILIWKIDESNATVECILRGHKDKIFSLEALPNEKLISAAHDGKIIVWSAFRRQPLLISITIGHEMKSPMKLTILPSGFIVTCSGGGKTENTLHVWNHMTGSLEKKVRLKSRDAHSLFGLADNRVAVHHTDDSIRFVDVLDSGRVTKPSITGPIRAQLPSGYLIFDDIVKSLILIWDPSEFRLVQSIHLEYTFIRCLALSDDGALLAFSSLDNLLKIFSLTYP